MNALFTDDVGREYSQSDIHKALEEIGAGDCETLFVHSDIVFGKPVGVFRRREYLNELYDAILSLNVKNIIVPTFTYSFCNHEIYDVNNSKTSMGALSEYIRKQEGRYRTIDPLLSMSVPDNLKDKFENISGHSLGEGSGFDIVHHLPDVKFLFFGARQDESFTYIHYVEKMLDVPYRYDQSFNGVIVDYDNNRIEKTQTIHTHCYGVKIPKRYDYFENELIEKGIAKKKRLGNSAVSCISRDDAYKHIVDKIKTDPFYFVEGKYTDKDLIHRYGFGENGERVTHC